MPLTCARDHVLHLHRFHDEELLARADRVALAHVERNDRPLHRRGDRDGAFRSGDIDQRGAHLRRRWSIAAALARAFAMMQHGERIARVDFRSGQASLPAVAPAFAPTAVTAP